MSSQQGEKLEIYVQITNGAKYNLRNYSQWWTETNRNLINLLGSHVLITLLLPGHGKVRMKSSGERQHTSSIIHLMTKIDTMQE